MSKVVTPTVTLETLEKLPRGKPWPAEIYEQICDWIQNKTYSMNKLSNHVPCSRPALIKRVRVYLKYKGKQKKLDDVTPVTPRKVTPPLQKPKENLPEMLDNGRLKLKRGPQFITMPTDHTCNIDFARGFWSMLNPTSPVHRGTKAECIEDIITWFQTAR